MLSVIFVFSLVLLLVRSENNLITNGRFENPNTIYPWKCLNCTANGRQDSYEGQWSVMITKRHQDFSALRQSIRSTGDKNYIFKSYIKLLNVAPGQMYTDVHVYVTYTDGGGHFIKKRFVDSPKLEVSFEWTELSGDFYIPKNIGNSFSVSVELPEHEVNYLFDNASIIEMQTYPNWKSQADSDINRLRKATLTLRPVGHSTNLNYCNRYGGSYCIDISRMYVEVKQTRSEYAFGGSVDSDLISGANSSRKYRQFIYDNFEWALIEDELSWKHMQSEQTLFQNTTVQDTLQLLKSKGLKTWGSGLFSALKRKNPDWIKSLPLPERRKAIQDRIDLMANKYNGSFDQIDVYTDILMDDFLEKVLRSSNITEELLVMAKQNFPTTGLFLTEKNVLNSSIHTTAYSSMAKRHMKAHMPISGLGVKAHFNTTDIDMDVIKYRLDKLADTNLPIWIDGLAIHRENITRRAELLDDIMTILYSRPEVKGIFLDEFWDGDADNSDTSLADGANFMFNEAGYVYQNRWHTHNTYHVDSTVSLRAYKGEYDIIVRRGGKTGIPIHTRHVTLGDGGQSLTIHVTGQGLNYQVTNFVFG